MKKIVAIGMAVIAAIFASCKKETIAPTVSVDMVSSETVLIQSPAGAFERAVFSLRFRVRSNQTVYFSPVPTFGKSYIQTTGSLQRPASSYMVVCDREGSLVTALGSMSFSAIGMVAIIGPSYIIPANGSAEFLFTFELEDSVVHGSNYRLTIPMMAVYRDPELKMICWMNSTEHVRTDYFFVP